MNSNEKTTYLFGWYIRIQESKNFKLKLLKYLFISFMEI